MESGDENTGWSVVEQDWGVGGVTYPPLEQEGQRTERGWVGVVSYPPDHSPTMGWDAGAHT